MKQKKVGKRKRRLMSLLLAFALCLSGLPVSPVTVYASESTETGDGTTGESSLCEHHTEHSEDCGHTEGEEEASCTHVCLDCVQAEDNGAEDSGTGEGTETEAVCACETACTEDAVNEGCPICSVEDADLTTCQGTATEQPEVVCSCEALEGETHSGDCPFYEALTEPVCTCETDDSDIHATNCPSYVAPENPECFCGSKCMEDSLNVWCDVCGVQGVDACAGTETAQTYAYEGNFGTDDSWHWSLADDGTLTITGTGEMPGWEDSTYTQIPWYNYFSSITKVVISDGVTSVGDFAFCNWDATTSSLISVELPEGLVSIGAYAFDTCRNLTSVTLPDSLSSIGNGAFCDCTNLALTELPDDVTSIGNLAFSGCTNLPLTNFQID